MEKLTTTVSFSNLVGHSLLTQPECNGWANPMKLVLNAHAIQDKSEGRCDDTDKDSRQAHLRLANASIPLCLPIGDPVREVAANEDADECSKKRRGETQPGLPRLEIIRRLECRCEV